MINVLEAIKYIYGDNSGCCYFYTKEDEQEWENPIDGLRWERKEKKPTWSDILAVQDKVKNRLSLKKEAENAFKYLASTDWYVIRQLEIGEEIPKNIKETRESAREKIREAKKEAVIL